MVVLRMGGIYADIDTECRKPLNNLILPRDTLVVGWENEFSTAEEAHSRKYVRKRQVGMHACPPLLKPNHGGPANGYYCYLPGWTAFQVVHFEPVAWQSAMVHAEERNRALCSLVANWCVPSAGAACSLGAAYRQALLKLERDTKRGKKAKGRSSCIKRCARCRLQVLQWTFAGAPGHPALREICDHIARSTGTAFSASTNIDTLERTGPGVWTDIILKHARAHPPSKVHPYISAVCTR